MTREGDCHTFKKTPSTLSGGYTHRMGYDLLYINIYYILIICIKYIFWTCLDTLIHDTTLWQDFVFHDLKLCELILKWSRLKTMSLPQTIIEYIYIYHYHVTVYVWRSEKSKTFQAGWLGSIVLSCPRMKTNLYITNASEHTFSNFSLPCSIAGAHPKQSQPDPWGWITQRECMAHQFDMYIYISIRFCIALDRIQ